MFLFDERYRTFELFSFPHIGFILVVIVFMIIIFKIRHRIDELRDCVIRRSLVVFLLGMEWVYYAWYIRTFGFNYDLLPFGVCALSLYVTSYALWFKSERVFQFILPWAITGAILSLSVANLSYTFPHFRYFHYFGTHGVFLIGIVYLLFVAEFTFSYYHVLKSSFYLFLYAVIIYPINYALDTNHLFLRAVPEDAAFIYAFLGPFWVVGFVFSIFMIFQIIYVPFWIVKRIEALSVKRRHYQSAPTDIDI